MNQNDINAYERAVGIDRSKLDATMNEYLDELHKEIIRNDKFINNTIQSAKSLGLKVTIKGIILKEWKV